jgi:Fe-S oxidoreductase/FAD/FMN-containing dehydrogenase
MTGILDIEEGRVTVQPGISWKALDRELKKQGYTLRLYPSSYPSSTVGGWLAQGGAGYGSWEYGMFSDNVLSARAVLGNGEVKTFSAEELPLLSDAEGTTGIITEVTLYIQEHVPVSVKLIGFEDACTLQSFIKEVRDLPIWSLSFANPDMVRLSNRTPLRTHHGQPAEERVVFPEQFLLMLAYRETDAWQVEDGLSQLAQEHEAEILPQELADHEWEERFNIMKVKRLGPSLVPAEIIVPVDSLESVLNFVDSTVTQPIVIEGMGISGDNMVLLGFIPHDQRRLTYNLAFPLALTVARGAKKHGGRPYSTGLYFAHEAPTVLGKDRLQRLKTFKREADQYSILNPGKVTGSKMAGLMNIAGTFEPLLRRFGNLFKVDLEEKIRNRSIKKLPDDVVWYAYACSSCGYCVDQCDQYYGRMWESQSPRGKWFYLRELVEGREKLDQEAVNTFLVCTTCEMCNVLCSEGLPIEPSWLKLREQFVEERGKMTIPPFEIMSASLDDNRNIWAYYSRNRADWVPEDVRPAVKEEAETLYFAGCTASFVEKDIAQSAARLLKDAGIEFTLLGEAENCCGLPMLTAGKWEQFAEIARHNLTEAAKRGVKTVVTSCPACWLSWHTFYKEWAEKLDIPYEIEVKHYSEVLAPKVADGTFALEPGVRAATAGTEPVETDPAGTEPAATTVTTGEHAPTKKITFHDSCHIGRAGNVYEPPRELLQSIPGTELVEMECNREQAHCCGSVLSLISEPEVAYGIGKTRLDEATEAGAEEVVALCPCCEFQFRVSAEKTGSEIKVTDLASYLAKAKGYEVKEDLPHVLTSWATFEAMIELMKPENMAEMMKELIPEMIDAMPMGMGSIMKFVGKLGPVGGVVLGAMKPLFPVLFPMLMPGMMPKIMPSMLEAVEKRVPMPDFMQEQMPELMPRAMDNLLPHMLPKLVPLISQPLIDYLRSPRAATKARV